jgi:PAS domain S-box-containing protein
MDINFQTQNLLAIVNASSDAIYGKDAKGNIIAWNQSAERIFGYSSEEIIGKPATILIPADRLEEEVYILKTISQGNSIQQLETVRRRKDGTLIELSFSISPIFDPSGLIFGASVVARDNQNHKAIQEELNRVRELVEQTRLAKSNFLANMSHEIRTPLNGILGFSDLLLQTELDHIQKDYLRIIFQSATSLMDVLSDILDYSKIETGKLAFKYEYTSLGDLAENLLSIYRHQANQKNIKLRLTISPQLPDELFIEPIRIRQILNNLMSNAIKFTDSGRIELSIAVLDHSNTDSIKVRISINDTGRGIASEHQTKIFEAFSQEDFSFTRKYGGIGIGLTISAKLLSMMESKLQLESLPNVGSNFFFDLDLKTAVERTIPNETRPVHRVKARDPVIDREKAWLILVVEDDSVNLMLMKAILKKIIPRGTFLEAEDGEQAVSIVEGQTPDLIFMDIQMPKCDGYEATKRIRNIRGKENIPIIAVTATTTVGAKETCLAAGMNDYLSKPAVKADFERMVQFWLGERHPVAEAIG